jgi:2-haloacid dehalogenase
MTLDVERVETVTVDSYGTLVDPSAAERALANRVEEPKPISDL